MNQQIKDAIESINTQVRAWEISNPCPGPNGDENAWLAARAAFRSALYDAWAHTNPSLAQEFCEEIEPCLNRCIRQLGENLFQDLSNLTKRS